MYQRNRNLVQRRDGKLVNVARPRGQLFVCSGACCCGRTEDGFAAVPVDLYHEEWERRRLRNFVHLTIGGCLGPCALANVVLLNFDGQALWFHSIDSTALILTLYDYIEAMLDAGQVLPAPASLAVLQFTASAWQPRPDGELVDDQRSRPAGRRHVAAAACEPASLAERVEPYRQLARLNGNAAVPRKNGELVFEAPWQGRAFGMAVALNEQQQYEWDRFREHLIASIQGGEARGEPTQYYESWLAAFESLLAEQGVVTPAEIEERTFEFEFGERDDVF